MKPFTYVASRGRVVFGVGAVEQIIAELRVLDIDCVFLIADGSAPAIGDRVQTLLGKQMAGRWNEVVQHVPVELAERALDAAERSGADAVVCVGGGSSTGLAKAIVLTTEWPIIAIPTTYAGSEMTSIYGMTGGAQKRTGKDPVVLPQTVIYDPALTVDLPANVTGPSAFNAIAHCVEALYGPGHNPVISVLALESIRAISTSLGRVIASPRDLDARGDLLYGAYLAGIALGATGTALHHKACHVLGGMFGLVHGDMNSVMLPHALACNASAVPDVAARVADALGTPAGVSAAAALYDLAVSVGAPVSLREIGMPESGIAAAAPHIVSVTNAAVGANPRVIDVASVTAMLDAAYRGLRPA